MTTAIDSRLASSGEPGRRRLADLVRGLRAGLRAVQYGQMVSVLNRLPDRQLKEAGLRRSDIPEHARRAVYGDD